MDLSHSESAGESGALVFVIDDDDNVREAIALVLERGGFTVTACCDARDALDRLRRGSLPDAILLDLMMPHMDGWEFRLEQRNHARLAQIPVLALSADRSPKAAAIDADAYLPKPVKQDQLLNSVARLVAEARRKRSSPNIERLRPLGRVASEVVRHTEAPLGAALGNLHLARVKADELGARLRGPDAFSMVGVRQLLERSQRAVQRLEAVIQGVAAFAHLAGEEMLRATKRVLLVDFEEAAADLFESEEEHEIVRVSVVEALVRLRAGELYDLILCDVSTPSVRGVRLYESLVAVMPDQAVRLAFVIGSSVDEDLRRFLESARRPLLRRPFGREELHELLADQHCTLN